MNWYIKYPNVELRFDYYLLPFDGSIWFILLVATILGTSLTLLSHRFLRNKKRSLIDDLFLGFETFLNQCGNEDIEGVYLKLKCILLRFTAIVSIGLYGAIITSYFAVETFRAPFTNLDEFMSKGEYKILLNSTLDLALLVHVKSYGANTREIYKNVTKFVKVNYFYELVEKICYGKYAITFEENDISYYTPPCKYYKIPQYFGVYWYGLLAKKNSFFTRIFNKNFIRFHENGMQRRWKKTIVDHTVSFNEIAGDSFEPIDLEMMIQVLAIPLVGIALSTGVIITEIIYEYLRLRKINQVKIFNG